MGNNKIFLRACALGFSFCACAAIIDPSHGLAAGKHKPQAAPAAAAAPQDETALKQKEAAAAHASYEAGVKSYQAGKYEPAVQSLTSALRGGGLSSTDMAHALFYRGVSFKKQSKPGLAISDLTSSLWLKNGLTDAERANATAERADAYRLAGLGDGNSGAETVSVADPNKPAAAPAAGESAPVAASKAQRAASQRDSAGAQSAAGTSVADGGAVQTSAPTPRANRSIQADQQLSAVNQNEPVFTPAAAATPVLSAAPMETAGAGATSASGAASTVSGFFSNMFGGAKSAPAPGQAPVTTASTTPAAATSSWNDTTSTRGSIAAGKSAKSATGAKVAAAQAPAFTTPAAPAPVAAVAAAAPAPVKGGKYKIHIAAVRSKAEAEALAQKLVQQHGSALASRSPTVDEAVIGSMGTFYRVRIGSFATAEEPRGLCNTLRTSGVDCLVVTN